MRANSYSSWLSVIVLSLAAVIFVTAELLPIGILHEIGDTYKKPVGTIGLIVTGYACVVGISAIFSTSLFINIERKKLLLILLISFGISNFIVAYAPSISILYIGRVIGAFSHGLFWSIIGPLAVRLVPGGGKARATSFVFGGIAIATVAVVPLGTFFSQKIGWKQSFFAIGLTSLIIAAIIIIIMPKLKQSVEQNRVSLIKLISRPYLRRTFPVTTLALCGHFCALTYIGPILETRVGIMHAQLPVYLLCFGIFGVLGNIIAGFLKDNMLVLMTRITLGSMAISVFGTAFISTNSPILAYVFVAIWGLGICLLTVTLQSLILKLAPDAGDKASSIHVAMFNAGIGFGALIGGLLINNFGSEITAAVGGTLLFLSLLILLPHVETKTPYEVNI
ncbi:MFS transporter [Photorhabdus asymbiotica]|uniref:MFS transporter n=1 Tax=Photorhabdus asymbiotica TaxID=291112 RepID=UPI003DA70E7E